MANLLQFLGSFSGEGPVAPTVDRPSACDAAIRKTLAEVVRNSPKSRQQIVDEMNAITAPAGTEITLNMLNGYTAESKLQARFPAVFVPAFCQVTGDDRLQRILLSPNLLRLVELAEHALVLHGDILKIAGLTNKSGSKELRRG